MSSSGPYRVPLSVSTFYDYDPVLGILIAAAIVFGLQSIVLTYQSLRSRAYFLLWLVVFTACEAGGYVAFSVFERTPSLNAYLGQLVLIILAPNFVTLVNYTVISRVIPFAGFEPKSLLARRGHLVPAFFLTSDLLCLVLQSIGGSQLSASHHDGQVDETKFNLGRQLNLAGISAQLGFQTVFALLAVYIFAKMPDRTAKRELRWAWLCMLLTMALVCVRNVYRIVEFAGGQHSAVDSTQVPYMVLDLLLMALTGCVFIVLDLGSDWVLPARIRSAAMLDNAAQVQDDAVAGKADVEKGKAVVVVEMSTATRADDSV